MVWYRREQRGRSGAPVCGLRGQGSGGGWEGGVLVGGHLDLHDGEGRDEAGERGRVRQALRAQARHTHTHAHTHTSRPARHRHRPPLPTPFQKSPVACAGSRASAGRRSALALSASGTGGLTNIHTHTPLPLCPVRPHRRGAGRAARCPGGQLPEGGGGGGGAAGVRLAGRGCDAVGTMRPPRGGGDEWGGSKAGFGLGRGFGGCDSVVPPARGLRGARRLRAARGRAWGDGGGGLSQPAS